MLPAAALTPLPSAPEVVLGLLDLQGEPLPVLDLRRRFRLPLRELASSDHFLVVRAGALRLGLAVDAAGEVIEGGELTVHTPERVMAGLGLLEGVGSGEEGLVLIHDLETLLFRSEEREILQALENLRS
ncbi:chemotaxis protein CheW [Geomonas sp. Red32]|nr:chemotaxis protein CheW [Geomonas sp. Red32]